MKQLSIVLITWNAGNYIVPCLDSVIQSVRGIDTEVLVVDNGSTDNSLQLLEKYRCGGFTLIVNEKNRGVATARNQALKLATGEYILILDIDTVVNPQAIGQLLELVRQNPRIGIAACRLVSAGGEVQMSCRKFPTIRYKLYNILESRNIQIQKNRSQFYTEQMKGNMPFEADYVIGACQLVRKKAMDEVGLLDEHIFYGPEDADFCYRMKQKGWKTVYLPAVSIIHHYQQMSSKKIFSKISFLHIKGLLYYFIKHRSF